jgi:hypothetical protein
MEAEGHFFISSNTLPNNLVFKLLPFFKAWSLAVVLGQTGFSVAIHDQEELDHWCQNRSVLVKKLSAVRNLGNCKFANK